MRIAKDSHIFSLQKILTFFSNKNSSVFDNVVGVDLMN